MPRKKGGPKRSGCRRASAHRHSNCGLFHPRSALASSTERLRAAHCQKSLRCPVGQIDHARSRALDPAIPDRERRPLPPPDPARHPRRNRQYHQHATEPAGPPSQPPIRRVDAACRTRCRQLARKPARRTDTGRADVAKRRRSPNSHPAPSAPGPAMDRLDQRRPTRHPVTAEKDAPARAGAGSLYRSAPLQPHREGAGYRRAASRLPDRTVVRPLRSG